MSAVVIPFPSIDPDWFPPTPGAQARFDAAAEHIRRAIAEVEAVKESPMEQFDVWGRVAEILGWLNDALYSAEWKGPRDAERREAEETRT